MIQILRSYDFSSVANTKVYEGQLAFDYNTNTLKIGGKQPETSSEAGTWETAVTVNTKLPQIYTDTGIFRNDSGMQGSETAAIEIPEFQPNTIYIRSTGVTNLNGQDVYIIPTHELRITGNTGTFSLGKFNLQSDSSVCKISCYNDDGSGVLAIENLKAPVNPTDAANKRYVDTAVSTLRTASISSVPVLSKGLSFTSILSDNIESGSSVDIEELSCCPIITFEDNLGYRYFGVQVSNIDESSGTYTLDYVCHGMKDSSKTSIQISVSKNEDDKTGIVTIISGSKQLTLKNVKGLK